MTSLCVNCTTTTTTTTTLTTETLTTTHTVVHDTTGTTMTYTEFFVTIKRMNTVLVPVLCLLGLIGNATAVGIFRSSGLKKKSCCLYLSSKCLVDTIFLGTLFVVWLDRLDVPWFHYHGVCQMIVFTSYVSAFLSVWLVVMATGENYARICHPHKVHLLCTPGKARAVLLFLCLVSIFCYQFHLWTTHSVISTAKNNHSLCEAKAEYERLNKGLTYFDTAVTLVLPLLLVIGFMVGIFRALSAAHQRNKRMKKLGRQRNTKFMCLTPYGQVTAMLLAVSLTFIVLHFPSHAIRLHVLLFAGAAQHRSLTVYSLHELFQLLYYANFSTNLFTYLIFGKAFRKLYVRAYFPCLTKEKKVTAATRHGLHVPMATYSVPLDEVEEAVVVNGDVLSNDHRSMVTTI